MFLFFFFHMNHISAVELITPQRFRYEKINGLKSWLDKFMEERFIKVY